MAIFGDHVCIISHLLFGQKIIQMPRFIHIHEIPHIYVHIEWPKISTQLNGKPYPERFIHMHSTKISIHVTLLILRHLLKVDVLTGPREQHIAQGNKQLGKPEGLTEPISTLELEGSLLYL